MIVVKLSGGLGNQMFQYSLAVLLRQMGKNVEIDLSSFQYVNEHCGPELLSVFNVEQSERLKHSFESFRRRERIIEKYSHFKLKHSFLPLPSSWKLKHLWRFDSPEYKLKSVNLKGIVFDAKDIKDLDNCILDGWAYPSCDSSTELELRKQFQFMHIPDRILHIISMIESTNSVGVHIRRGDFLPSKNRKGSIALLENYYNDSIKTMNSILMGGGGEVNLFIFSDDIGFSNNFIYRCFQKESVKNVYFIDDNKGEDSYLDMYLMSRCKHNIIANSTFSWWSAWLNANSDKVIISPSRFYGDEPMIRCCDNQIILQY